MLVIDGALHPRFMPGSDSTYIRNGVGVSADGTRAVFAISNDAVNFHAFARLFRDELGLPDALYFDGNVSRLYAPRHLAATTLGFPMGPIVGTVVPPIDARCRPATTRPFTGRTDMARRKKGRAISGWLSWTSPQASPRPPWSTR